MAIDKIQQSFLKQQLHNAQVNHNLDKIKTLAEHHNTTQLIQNLQQWSDSSPVLTMTNTLFWTLMGSGILIAIVFLLLALPIWFLIIPIGLIIFAFIKKENNRHRDELIDELKLRCLAEKYDLQFNSSQADYSPSQLIQHFPLFQLGNYDNEIRQTATGNIEVLQHHYPFTLFQYHYVDEVEDRDKDGNVSYRYHHYDRWGIFIHEIPIQGISISTHQKKASRLGVKWTTSDIAFNKNYQLSGQNEMTLARFFNPARILLLEQILTQFKGDVYFHPNAPVLCWQFSSDIFTTAPTTKSIDTIHQLAQALEQLHMPIFEDLRHQITQLLEKITT